MIDERLQSDFWLSEFLRSETAVRRRLDNTPTPEALVNIRTVLAPGAQRVRNVLGAAVNISSGYRSPAVNRAVKGSATSQHCQGLAMDFTCPAFGPAKFVAKYLADRSPEIRFDQLIYEGAWVHVSFTPGTRRGEILTAHFDKPKTYYTPGVA